MLIVISSLNYSVSAPTFSNSTGLKNVVEKLRFGDGLVWTEVLTKEVQLLIKFQRRIGQGTTQVVNYSYCTSDRSSSTQCLPGLNSSFKDGESEVDQT